MSRPIISKGEERWMVVVPPSGAARAVGNAVVRTMQEEFVAHQAFDTLTFMEGYRRLLKDPQEDLVVDMMNQSLLCKIFEERCTMVLVLSLAPVTPYFLSLMRGQGIRVVHWFYEDYRIADYWLHVHQSYDLFCAVQKGPVLEACQKSKVPFRYLPNACQYPVPDSVLPWASRRYDVGFVGLPSPYRIAVLESLKAGGLRLAIAGEAWESYRGILDSSIVQRGWAGPQQAAAIYADSRMIVNLSYGDPSSDAENRQISPRAWDAIAFGAYLLTEHVPLAVESLHGLQLQEFGSPNELLAACMQLRQVGMPDSIQHSNRESIRQHHCLSHRLHKLIAWTRELK